MNCGAVHLYNLLGLRVHDRKYTGEKRVHEQIGCATKLHTSI